MIRRYGDLFYLDTGGTSYLFKALPSGHLQHIYYGKHVRIDCEEDAASLVEKQAFARGNTNSYDEENSALTLEDICLEMSSLGRGDIREPFVSLKCADGSSTVDFLFSGAEISKGKPEFDTLPGSYDETGAVEHLCVLLEEKAAGLTLELHYYVYEDCDVISRSARLVNHSEATVTVERLLSTMLDIDCGSYVMTTFGGGWAREMKRSDTPLIAGKHVNESLTGTTSSRANNFVILHETGAGEDAGACYGFHLIYSGNHYEAAQVSAFGKLRFVCGIHPETFSWQLAAGESFEAPEAVMTFSPDGMTHMSHNLHAFIREHIVRGAWKKRERPVLVNSWEAMYFNISESKLLRLAKAGANLGAELFVMDDGWFGERNDDKRSLGDWVENKKKLPGGLKGLADKIHALGMDFGIWVEPEMVNTDSDLYRAHPDWTVDIPGRAHSEGRNQRILDLTRAEVQEYILEAMRGVFSSADISYVKWDMNRTFTDIFSRTLPADRQGEVMHRYYMGLYRVMKTLTEEFPEILFEGCSAGGNRFDLGILCYFPQIWASDDTDALVRCEIQTNYSYGYPQSVIGAHVSSCPNHQTLRNTPLKTRFNVAACGLLGYECNLNDLSDKEKKDIKEQIGFYKAHRKILQYGDFYRGRNWGADIKALGPGCGYGIAGGFPAGTGYSGVLAEGTGSVTEWTIVGEEKKEAIGVLVNKLAVPNWPSEIYAPKGLDEERRYHFTNMETSYSILEYGELINTVSPVHIKNGSLVHRVAANVAKMKGETEDYTAYGNVLMSGVRLAPAYAATGLSEAVRHYPDFASRMYVMTEETAENDAQTS